ncbi:MAG: preprotein translocase subunit SecG [Pseudomonadota bacterium]
MENVLLIIHLIIAICLIAAVLLQRSEGGALGIGGGGGGGLASSRSAATAMSKVTWGLAAAFITTSITLAILAGGDPAGRSVLDELGTPQDGILLPDLPAPADDDGAGISLPALPPSDSAPEPAPALPPTAD